MKVRRIVIRKPISVNEYVINIIADFNRGMDEIELYAVGTDICKLADTVAALKNRLDNRLSISGWKIDSRRIKGERKTYLVIRLKYSPF